MTLQEGLLLSSPHLFLGWPSNSKDSPSAFGCHWRKCPRTFKGNVFFSVALLWPYYTPDMKLGASSSPSTLAGHPRTHLLWPSNHRQETMAGAKSPKVKWLAGAQPGFPEAEQLNILTPLILFHFVLLLFLPSLLTHYSFISKPSFFKKKLMFSVTQWNTFWLFTFSKILG